MRIGLIGTGVYGRGNLLPAFAAVEGVEVAAAYDTSPDALRLAMSAFDIGTACGSAQELIDLPQVDLVCVATPPFAHLELLRAVIAANKPFFCEKPCTMSSAQAGEIHRLASARGLVGAVDHEYRYAAVYQEMRRLIATGYVGDLRQIAFSFAGDYAVNPRFPLAYYWSFVSQLEKGGGILPQRLSHVIDLFEFVAGGLTALSGYCPVLIPEKPAMIANPDGTFAAGAMRPVDAEDAVALTGMLPNGAPASIVATQSVPKGAGTRWGIYGSSGSLVFESASAQFGGQLRGATGEDPVMAPLPVPPGEAPHDQSDAPHYNRLMVAAEVRDIMCAVGGEPTDRHFATVESEARVWKNIERWRASSAEVMRAGA